jgi:hypothetical protein
MIDNENQTTEEFLAEIGLGQSNENNGSQQQQNQGNQNSEEKAIDSPSFFGEEFTDWKKVKEEIPQRLQKYRDLETEVSTLRSAPIQYSDPEIGEYDSFVKNTGKKDWSLFQKVKETEALEGIDALVLKTVFENPELSGKEDQIRSRLVSDYKIDPQLYDPEGVDFALNKKRMEQDAATAKDWFQDLKGKVKVELQSPEQIENKRAEKLGQWKSAVQETVNQVTKIPIPIWDGKNVQLLGEYEVKEEHRSAFVDPLSQAFAGMELNEQNKKVVGSEFTDRFIARNLPYIIDHAVKLREAQIRTEIEAEYGGSIHRPPAPGGANNGKISELDEYLNN